MAQSTFSATRTPDPAITVPPARFRASETVNDALTDRKYIDDQARAAQAFLSELLLNATLATKILVNVASASLVAGDVVCARGTGSGLSVTLATAAALAAAGAPLGIVLASAAPGTVASVHLLGMVPPTVTLLAATAGFARVTALGRVERVAAFVSGDYPIGTIDALGNLALDAGLATVVPVTSVGVTAPIINTGTATAPVIDISPATALNTGSLSIAHFDMLAGATAAATADELSIRGASGELTAAWFAAGLTSFLSTGITFDKAGTTSISKTAASAGAGGDIAFAGAGGAVGSAGGNVTMGPGIGGTPDSDAPGGWTWQMGSNGTDGGSMLWRAGSLGDFLTVRYVGASSAARIVTTKATLELDAATSHKLQVATADKLTVAAALVTVSTALTVTGIVTASSQVIESGEVAVNVGTNQNNLSAGHTTATTIYINATAAFNITGLTGGIAGRVLRITNGGTFAITLTHDDGASTAANRFTCPGAASFLIYPGETAFLKYRPSTSRWIVQGTANVLAALAAAAADIDVNAQAIIDLKNPVNPQDAATKASSESYTPGEVGNWAGTAPTTIAAALDRLAAHIRTGAGAIPIEE